MKIVIDTKHDSPEEIKHIINVLAAMISGKTIRDEPEQIKQEDIFNQKDILGSVFGPPSTGEETQKTDKDVEKRKIDIEELKLEGLETY